MPTTLDYRPQVMRELRAKRRKLAGASAAAFAQIYLLHHFTAPPSRMHEELFDLLADMNRWRGARLAIAAPRGHAKTTLVSFAYVLWSLLYGRQRFILLISSTREQSVQLMTDLKRELTGNERLIEDFPEICEPLIRGRGPVTVKAHHLVLPNDCCLRVLGSNQGLRGMKHRENRPSLIVCDDLEDLEQAQSEDQRAKLHDWFTKTLLKSGTPAPGTNIVVVGTILHYDALLAKLTDPKHKRGRSGGWESRVYRAVESFSSRPDLWETWESVRFGEKEHEGRSGVEASAAYFEQYREAMLEGTEVLWPEVEDYHRLMCIRADEGRSSFQSEKQNEPLDPSRCLFRPESFRYWDDDYPDVDELVAAVGGIAEYYGACDPSLGKRAGRGDYTAVITLLKDRDRNLLYVIGAEIARRTPDQVIENILQLGRVRRFNRFMVEANQFQELLADQLQDRADRAGVRMRIEKITTTTNKQGRIEALEPLIAQGVIRFSRRHALLLDQLRRFPLGAHDDGPDALEMAAAAAVQPRSKLYVTDIRGL